ncbi:hypothetical protein, partial [Nocardia cyriacigeorgica]|uniref:hypothetical protein n=1 Tax=Nocardia cyriacigeorgica TaxID=135487 RepID=UPI003CC7D76D
HLPLSLYLSWGFYGAHGVVGGGADFRGLRYGLGYATFVDQVVDDHDAAFGGGGHVDVVEVDAGPGDDLQVLTGFQHFATCWACRIPHYSARAGAQTAEKRGQKLENGVHDFPTFLIGR